MTVLIVSNAALIVIKICEILNFVSKIGVFHTCCKWAKHYNIKSVSQWGTAGVFTFVTKKLQPSQWYSGWGMGLSAARAILVVFYWLTFPIIF